ncbi:MAG: aldo/keto reductase [Chloroflexi bacterium]|nr:aldo/keto reductase [Chloroflexota bacterium]
MKYRTLGTTEFDVSEVGFGLWTVSTNWWGKIDEPDGVKLLQKALDLGVNFFDTADTYAEGYGERILAKALGRHRHDIVIGTKFGYDFYANVQREGHQERPQNFTPEFIRYACEQSLKRLDTDYIDLYQLHNPRIDTIEKDEVFDTLDELVKEGKIRYSGVALGPDIGWFEEGEASMRERKTPTMQIIYSIMEQEPARRFFPIASEESTGLITRVPHASGLLDGTYTKDTVFDPSDHRSHRRREWLERGLKKLAELDFLMENMESTIGQLAIKFALSGPQVASVLPNITDLTQLEELAATSDTGDLPEESVSRVFELYDEDFYLEPAPEPSPAG